MEDAERVSSVARRIFTPSSPAEAREIELLLRFRGIGSWLNKMGNLSRTLLSVRGLNESELRCVADSIRSLEQPRTPVERAVAGAILIDGSGIRGLAERMARARREGMSVHDVVRESLGDSVCPDWMPERGRDWLRRRQESRRVVCSQILEEIALRDLPAASTPHVG